MFVTIITTDINTSRFAAVVVVDVVVDAVVAIFIQFLFIYEAIIYFHGLNFKIFVFLLSVCACNGEHRADDGYENEQTPQP